MKTYDNLIIGFGKGGKTLAASLAKAGQRTALIEKSPLMYGGTCINVACLPTKSLENSARQSAIQGGDDAARQQHFRQAIEEKRIPVQGQDSFAGLQRIWKDIRD